MKFFCVLLALLMFLSVMPAALADGLTPEWMEREFKARHIVGGVVVVSRYGETVFSYCYGTKTNRGTDRVTPDTVFRVASVTKLVSTVGLMQLYDQGYFRMDDSLSDLLPFPVINTEYPDEPITVRQLLSHTTGILATARPQSNWGYLSRHSSATMFRQHTPPGTRFIYSNANGGMVGGLIEALIGQSVNTYMRQNIFAPLGVNAAYTARLLPDRSDIANELKQDGSIARSVEGQLNQDYEDTCDPAAHLSYTVGGLHISANGLNRIGMMLCNEGFLDGKRILRPDTVYMMQQDPRSFPGSTVHTEGRYTVGMQRVEDGYGNIWYGHQGMFSGLTSDMFYQPEHGLVVTVIANGYQGLKDGVLVSLALRTMDKSIETDWD